MFILKFEYLFPSILLSQFEVGDSAWPSQEGAKQDESKSTPQDQDKSQSDGVAVKTEAGSSEA